MVRVPTKRNSKNPLTLRLAVTLALLLTCTLSATAFAASANVCFRAAPAHACLADADPLASCQQALDTDPYDLNARFSLCEVYLQDQEVMQALLTLDQGLKLCGRNKSACSRLQITLSNLEERSEQQARDDTSAQRNATKAKQETQRRICLKRMKGDLSLNSCKELLVAFPKDATLHEALAIKLVKRGQPAQAVSAFRTAQALGADSTAIQEQLAKAEVARQALVKSCMASSDLNACNRALLVGSADESKLQARRATLLSNAGNRTAALEASIIAQSLDGKNRAIAKQVLNLAGNNQLSDARHYFARGKARATLGSSNAALGDLRTALARGHDSTEINPVLTAVLKVRAAQVERECLQQLQLQPCERLIIASEPDRALILQHMDKLKTQAALAAAAKQDTVQQKIQPQPRLAERTPQPTTNQTPDQKPAPAAIAADEAPTKTVAVTSSPKKEPSSAITGSQLTVPTLVTYANQANKQGMTY